MDRNWLILTFGLIGVLVLVFAESGLLLGFFLPGASRLFTTGHLIRSHRGNADASTKPDDPSVQQHKERRGLHACSPLNDRIRARRPYPG